MGITDHPASGVEHRVGADWLQLKKVSLRLRERRLFEPLDLEVTPGEVVTVIGESGSGKSSLLAWVCGTLAPAFTAEGEVWLGGSELTRLPPEQRRLGILFQDDLLFPHLSVGENLLFGLTARVRGRAERRQRITEALAGAGMAGFEDRDPATLSGGQRARVSVLRVLLSEPRALLLDEPFSKLDAALRSRFREFVFGEVRSRRLPTLLVTHDPADREGTDGRVIQLACI